MPVETQTMAFVQEVVTLLASEWFLRAWDAYRLPLGEPLPPIITQGINTPSKNSMEHQSHLLVV